MKDKDLLDKGHHSTPFTLSCNKGKAKIHVAITPWILVREREKTYTNS